ncbi:MAG TPA: hypothetical protein VMH87_00840 [Pseudomonadales bacterium]|nr:hypothetical protein [Pseudomonadales bacterium]
MKSFYGEILIEDPQLGRKTLYASVDEYSDGKLIIELHNANPPNSILTLIGRYGQAWTLRKIKWGILVRVYEITFLEENPPVKARCVAIHKFGRMLESAIKTFQKKSPIKQ